MSNYTLHTCVTLVLLLCSTVGIAGNLVTTTAELDDRSGSVCLEEGVSHASAKALSPAHQQLYTALVTYNDNVAGEIEPIDSLGRASGLCAAGQTSTLSGTVRDAATGESLIGVTVFVPETNQGTVTNEYGFYSIGLAAGEQTIRFTYLGYADVERTVDLTESVQLNIDMSESEEALEVVVIQADGERTNIRTPQMSVNALTSETIKKIPVVLGEADVVKAITLLPGVTTAGEGASGFNVRGGAQDQNLILLDEAIIFNSSHLFGFFSVFNPDAIKDLKLYKGGIPARYGGRISSVLQIYQRDGNRNQFAAEGGIGLVASRLLLEGPIEKGKSSFLIAGRSSYAQIFTRLLDLGSTASFYDLNTKISFELDENNSLYVSGYFGRDLFDINDTFKNVYGNSTANVRWNHLFSDKLFANLSVIYADYDYELDFGALDFDFQSGIQNFNAKYDLQHSISDRLRLDYGLQGIYYQFEPGKTIPRGDSGINPADIDDQFGLESSAYLEAAYKVTDRLNVRAGLRLSRFDRFGQQFNVYAGNPVNYNEQQGVYVSADPVDTINPSRGTSVTDFTVLEPRLSASYRLSDDVSVKGSYQRTAQYIHLISNTNAPTPFDVYTPSGPFIEPQIADQVAAGAYKRWDNYTLEVEGFFKTVQNRLDYIDDANLIANDAIERSLLAGEARAYGLEVLLRKTKGRFTGWVAYTLSRSEQRTDGGNVGGPGINNGEWYKAGWDRLHDLSATASYELNDRWTFGGVFVLQSGIPATFPVGAYEFQGQTIPVFEARNASRLPTNHRLDLSTTLNVRDNPDTRWKSQWVFSVYNVYNRRNAASISFGPENGDVSRPNVATRFSFFGAIPSVTYNFKY